MKTPHVILSLFVSAALLVGCASREKTEQRGKSGPEHATESTTPWQPPEVPPMSETESPLPAWASTQPDFPWLPGEDKQRSRSIGDVSDGWLVNAVAIPQPHDHLRRIESHVPRKLDYSTQEMIDLVKAAADHVAKASPGAVLYLGNFSADGGGDIPYSVSHNSGRDADLAFYVLDKAGKLVAPDDLHAFDSKGKARAGDGTVYTFDVARNWKLIEGLALASKGQIQFVFVSNPLRKMLLAEAKRVKAGAEVVAIASEFLNQPGGAMPHNDHFHIRLYCSEIDVISGCVNGGRKNKGFDDFSEARAKTVKQAEGYLTSKDADIRLAATQRLGLLGSTGSSDKLAKRLNDDDPRVRCAAARALAAMRREESAVAARLAAEDSAHVRAELVWALGDYGTQTATETLTSVLDTTTPVDLEGATIDLRVFVADVLSVTEDARPVPALIELTASEDQDVRFRANRALKMLTNQDPGAKPKASLHDAWKSWWKVHGKQSRDAWLLDGFKPFGVKALSLKYVWELTYPVLEDDHLSYNAQRTLMRLAKRDAPSLEWAKTDANFYWRRWFERRCPRLGCPKIPPKLTTLD